jgi:hypothetical protein
MTDRPFHALAQTRVLQGVEVMEREPHVSIELRGGNGAAFQESAQ